MLAKRTTTKEKLAVWLETVCCILDQYAIPWLEKAAPLSDEVEKLKSEKIADQKTVISLQNKLIEAHEKNVESVQNVVKTTVETEMTNYASAVTKSCSSALAPRKIATAVKKVTAKEERSRNIMIYGMVESQQENVLENVKTILSEIDEKPVITECRRVGTQKTGAIRPVKFAVSSADHAIQVMRNARKLRTKEGYGSVYICPDRSLEERRAYKKLVEEVKQKRTTEPDKFHIIKNNKIVSLERKHEPAQTGTI